MATFTHNASEVLRSSKATRRQMRTAMFVANRRTADQGVEYTRGFIPPPQGAGRFPGYAATGALRNAVSARGPMPITGGVKSEIYMKDDRTRIYRAIHEFGGIIRAKRAPYLVFKVKGQWVKVKQVRIRPKRYWSGGWRYGRARFGADFARFFKQALGR